MRGLTVIIPSRNQENLSACVRAVRAAEPDLWIIVIDDGLPADWGLCRPNLYVLPGVEPFCYARNVNIGIRAAGEDDVVLLNDDALLETAGGFREMQSVAGERPDIGVLAARTNVARITPQTVAFVCVLLPRRVIQAVGLLDERFTGRIDGELVYGGEDDDYCYRVRSAGLRVAIYSGCYVDHSKLPSTFRPDGGGLPINAARKRFAEIHGFEMGTR